MGQWKKRRKYYKSLKDKTPKQLGHEIVQMVQKHRDKLDRAEKRTRVKNPLIEHGIVPNLVCSGCRTTWSEKMIICEKCGTELHAPWVVIPHGDIHIGKMSFPTSIHEGY